MQWYATWSGQGLGAMVFLIILLVPFWRITTRAGYSGFWSLLILIPLVNLLYLYFLAFARWPRYRNLF